METLGNGRLSHGLVLCCAFWGLCLASPDYDGECASLHEKLLLLKVLDTQYPCKIPENSFFKAITWQRALIEIRAYSN